MKPAQFLAAVLLLASFTPFAGAVAVRREPQPRQYDARNYRRAMVGPSAAARVGASATWGQIWNHPHEWKRGIGGFGKRLASGAATHAVGTSIEFGVGHMLHEERYYHRSDDPRFKARFRSALANTFLVCHRGSSKRRPAAGRITGAIGAGLISRLWQPASVATVGAGMSSAGISLGADFGINLAREYWPRKRHTIAANELRTR